MLSRAMTYLPTEGNHKHVELSPYSQGEAGWDRERNKEWPVSPGTQVCHHTWLAGTQEGFSRQVYPFFNVRDELTIQDSLNFRVQQVVVPQSLRPLINTKLYSWHIRIDACLRRARKSVFWPGFSAEINRWWKPRRRAESFRWDRPTERTAGVTRCTLTTLGEDRSWYLRGEW